MSHHKKADAATARALEAAQDIARIAADFTAAMDEAGRIAAELADAEARHRVALHQAGLSCRRPPARELAAEIVLGSLGALRPYLGAVSEEARDRAAEALALPCGVDFK